MPINMYVIKTLQDMHAYIMESLSKRFSLSRFLRYPEKTPWQYASLHQSDQNAITYSLIIFTIGGILYG